MEIEREERNGSGYQEKQEFITGIYYEYERLMFATARRYIDDGQSRRTWYRKA